MNPTTPVTLEIRSLIEAVCDGMADDAQVRDLESLLLTDEQACKFYVYLLDLDAKLQWLVRSRQEGDVALKEFVAAKQTPQQPAPTLPATLWHGTVGWFSLDWCMSYLIATVIVGIGALIGSRTPAFYPQQLARQSSVPSRTVAEPKTEPVGRITGMVDCKWEGSAGRGQGSGVENQKSFVALGDKFILSSGLMEITYDTGAKVILQGPCTYNAESTSGGYLSIGKLTARVEKKTKSGKRKADEKSEIPNPQSPISNPLFFVRTPTATVTDLGTEFGVEVKEAGVTEAYVLHGRIEVQRRDAGGHVLETTRLAANQAVRVEGVSLPISRVRASSERFVRSIPRDRRLDVVAWCKFDDIIDGVVLRTPDSSGHGRSGILREMTGDSLVPGKAGKALAFNVAKGAVNQRVVLLWSPALGFAGQSFTLAIWINRQAAGTEEDEIILQKEAGSGDDAGGYSMMRKRESGRLVFRARNAAGQATCIAANTSGDGAPVGVWVHFAVVGVYDPGSNSYRVALYRNGVRAGGQDNVTMASPRCPLSIGGLEEGWAFRGWLDDLQIYSRALDETEIRAIVAHPGAVPPVETESPNKPEGGQAMNGP